ncbi:MULTISPECIES: hypothetical protein [Nocardiopsis]|uniref:hypothetical protein n=1 Tax=Nocardiopsis TaxID=2013 RepID=UPI00197CCF6E|nr:MULTISPECIES: hypothetical protein [Nocardiopsis]
MAIDQRVAIWNERLAQASGQTSLSNLYKGEQWAQSRALTGAAARAGWTPKLWVASAGLGLQPVSEQAPPYGATFSSGHVDSVASTNADRRIWWDHLQRRRGAANLRELGEQGPVLLVLSESYSRILQAELRELGRLGGDVLLLGGDREVPGIHRVPSNRALRHALGGTLTSLNARMAISWVGHCSPGGPLTAPDTVAAWGKWAAESEKQETYDRRPMTDEEVRAFILTAVRANPNCSKTKLLRLLREEGMACEQKRFATLYVETMGDG